MSEGFLFEEHTADVKFHAFGETLEEAFGNAAVALFETMLDTSCIRSAVDITVDIEAEDAEALLYDFLSELLFVFDADGLALSEFDVSIQHNEKWHLFAKCKGEPFDPSRHHSRTEVKAITFHELSVRRMDGGYELTVVLDI